MFFIRSALVVTLISLVFTPSLCARVIDDFQTPQIGLSVGGPVAPQTGTSVLTPAAGVIGNERDLQILLQQGSLQVRVDVVDGVLGHSTDVNTFGVSVVTWDGIDGDGAVPGGINTSGLGGIDLTEGGLVGAFILELRNSNAGPIIEIEVFSGPGNSSISSFNIVSTIESPGMDVIFPFSAFSVNSGSGADFTNVGAITLSIITLSSIGGVDTSIEWFGTEDPPPQPVPVPGLGLTGLLIMFALFLIFAANAKRLRIQS